MQTEIGFGVITTDNELNIISWNPWIENVSGKKLNKGEKLTLIFPEIIERNFEKILLETLRSNSVTILSSTFHKYLIKCKPIIPSNLFNEMQQLVTISPLHDGTKKIGLIIVIKDVTEEIEKSRVGNYSNKETINFHETSSKLFINLGSEDWEKRKEAAESISKNHFTLLNEIVSRIKNEHKNLNVINSALQVLINTPAEVDEILIELLNSDDTDLRIYAAQTMGEKNDPVFIGPLINALDDPNQNVKYHAIEALGKLNAKNAINKILEFALSEDFFISFPAIDALKNIGDPNIAIKLLPLINNEIFSTVVIETIGKIGNDKIINNLCDIINNNFQLTPFVCNSLIEIYYRHQKSLDEGEQITNQISKYINANGIENIINSIPNVSNDSKSLISISKILSWLEGDKVEKSLTSLIHNEKVRDYILDSLIKLGNKIAPLLHSQIKIADPETKYAIINVLGRIGNKESVSILIESLDEYDERICVASLGALAKIGDHSAFESILKFIGSENPSIRRAAISALNSIGHPKLEKTVLELIKNPNPIIRESAVRIAGYFGFPKTKEFVFNCCYDDDENVRVAAIENLPFFDDESAIKIIRDVIKNETAKCKNSAVKALAHIDGIQSIDLLINSLNDHDTWVKINAIRSLVFHNYRQAEKLLMDIAVKDNSIPVKINAIDALGEIGSISSISVLLHFIEDRNSDIVKSAIKSLCKLNFNETITPILNILKSDDEEKKLIAIESLSNKDQIEIIEALNWIACTDKNLNIKLKAIETLSNIGTKDSIDKLIKLSAEKDIREYVIKALSKQKIKNIFVIAKGLENDNYIIKSAIIEALTRMKNIQASEIIYTCLDDDDPNIRAYAIQALDKLGNRNQEKKIYEMLLNDPDMKVKIAANDYLKIKNTV
ncbi:MAG: HEAT repeat domain-containing protein [Stygiobacter sp.]